MAIPTTPTGNAGQVLLGPGAIYVAPIGTAEPVSATGTLDAAYIQVGYTQDGSSFEPNLTVAEIEVAEQIDPILYATTKRATSFITALAQVNATNLNLAINNGAVAAVAGKGIAPPAPGSELRVMIVHAGQNGSLLSIRRAISSGAVKIDYKKAPNYSTLPITWNVEIPVLASASLPPGSTGFEPWWYFPTATGLVA